MSYSVSISGPSASRTEVEEYLARLPDVRREADVFEYSDIEADVTAEIRLFGTGAEVIRLEVTAPTAVQQEAADRVSSLCIGLARHLDWEVRDPATGGVLAENELRRRFSGASPTSIRVGGCISAGILVGTVWLSIALLR